VDVAEDATVGASAPVKPLAVTEGVGSTGFEIVAIGLAETTGSPDPTTGVLGSMTAGRLLPSMRAESGCELTLAESDGIAAG
jgi:hypothetical protein